MHNFNNIILSILAILHYRTFRHNKKQNLKIQHAFIHGYVIVLTLLAACTAIISHVYGSPPIANFYSLHSWLGVVTIVMFLFQVNIIYNWIKIIIINRHVLSHFVNSFLICIMYTSLQFIIGFISYLYPGISIKYREVVMPYHVYFGVFSFVLAVITTVLGFSEKLILALYYQHKIFLIKRFLIIY